MFWWLSHVNQGITLFSLFTKYFGCSDMFYLRMFLLDLSYFLNTVKYYAIVEQYAAVLTLILFRYFRTVILLFFILINSDLCFICWTMIYKYLFDLRHSASKGIFQQRDKSQEKQQDSCRNQLFTGREGISLLEDHCWQSLKIGAVLAN